MFERFITPIIQNTQGVSINSGIMIYCLVAIIFLVKQRSASIKNKIIGLLFILYIGKVLDLTLFPIPLNHREVQNAMMNFSLEQASIEYYNLIPFQNITGLKQLKEPLLNILMMVPMGIFLPVVFKSMRRWHHTVLTAFLLSLTIELLELGLTLGFGVILWHFDVSDLITNTLGGFIGYLLYYFGMRHILAYYDQQTSHWMHRQGLGILSVVLLFVFMITSVYLDVSADEVIQYNLNMRNMISNGKSNNRYYNFEPNRVVMSGEMNLKREQFEGYHKDIPTIELKQKVLFLDYSFGKYEVGPLFLQSFEDEGDMHPFELEWDIPYSGSKFYFITESKIATARKIGQGQIINP